MNRREEKKKKEKNITFYIHSTTERYNEMKRNSLTQNKYLDIKQHHHDTTIGSFWDHSKLFGYTNRYPVDDSRRLTKYLFIFSNKIFYLIFAT